MDGPLETPIVFVYGALRSGTTLLRVILAAHRGIENPGEADFLFDYLAPDPSHPTGWRYDRTGLAVNRIFRAKTLDLPADKDGLDLLADMLGQFVARAPGQKVTLNLHRHAERLMAILPEVRLIHLLRDPRDVALSSIGMGWAGTIYHGVGHWIDTERSWEWIAPALSPDQALTLRYEDLLADIEGRLSVVCAFLDVPFDLAMLEYHKSTTYGPPDASLVDQWRRHATRAEIAPLEARAADLMAACSYAPSGPIEPPGSLARLSLWTENKIAVWRFGLRRYGPGLYFGRKVTRRLGMRRLNHQLVQRMDEIDLGYLK